MAHAFRPWKCLSSLSCSSGTNIQPQDRHLWTEERQWTTERRTPVVVRTMSKARLRRGTGQEASSFETPLTTDVPRQRGHAESVTVNRLSQRSLRFLLLRDRRWLLRMALLLL